MTFSSFNELTEREMKSVLWNEGAYVASKVDQGFTVALYQLHAFYVEVYYHHSFNQIERIRSFSNTEQLIDYLHHIDISSLLK